MSFISLAELQPLPPWDPSIFSEASLQVSLIIPARKIGAALQNAVEEAHRFLKERYSDSFEIILVPNPAPNDPEDNTPQIAENLAQRFSSVHVYPHSVPPGKGAAIRTGIRHSRGKWIFLTDADLPYDLEFFDRAAQKLRIGYDLVTGNRRLPQSHFNIPVELLSLAYGRHRLGLAFNRCVRWLLPISTTDTQAGIKALTRRLAVTAFSKQTCPGFLYDLELFLAAHSQNYGQTDLPVTLYLNSEKSTVRILRECVLVANWLSRLTWQSFRGLYGPRRKKKVVNRYQGASFSTRLFLSARWKLTPYSQMASRLPQSGKILDLGCGHGLFALAAAMHSPSREIVGIDHDSGRIQLGAQAVQDIPNIRLETGNLMRPPRAKDPYSGIAMIDVMHYFDPEAQEALLRQARELLKQGGTLLVREVDPNGGMTSVWNRFYEKLATGIGFTQAEKKGLHFRSRRGWEEVLEKSGFKVNSERCSSFLFADILYICERTQ